ncbi:lopap-like isoform X2 [Eurosta solidaginis]|uniref:lopap-like isoform X2 n=1 Tax=Eurosta solidaginis TaxID=178769 RepID=UPI0035308741
MAFLVIPLSILFFFTSSCLVAGQVIKSGCCRTDIKYLSSVDIQAYKGSWFMQTRYPFWDDVNYRCHKTDYIPARSNVHMVSDTRIKKEDESEIVRTGRLTFLQDGQFTIEYDNADALPFKYIILNIVYNEYAIIYTCEDLPPSLHAEYVWIQTRVPNPSQEVKNAYMAALNKQGFSTKDLVPICQKNCPNYGKSVEQHQSKRQRKSF